MAQIELYFNGKIVKITLVPLVRFKKTFLSLILIFFTFLKVQPYHYLNIFYFPLKGSSLKSVCKQDHFTAVKFFFCILKWSSFSTKCT